MLCVFEPYNKRYDALAWSLYLIHKIGEHSAQKLAAFIGEVSSQSGCQWAPLPISTAWCELVRNPHTNNKIKNIFIGVSSLFKKKRKSSNVRAKNKKVFPELIVVVKRASGFGPCCLSAVDLLAAIYISCQRRSNGHQSCPWHYNTHTLRHCDVDPYKKIILSTNFSGRRCSLYATLLKLKKKT